MKKEYLFTMSQHLEKLQRGDADAIAFDNKLKKGLARIKAIATLTPLEQVVFNELMNTDYQQNPTAKVLLENIPFVELKTLLPDIQREKNKHVLQAPPLYTADLETIKQLSIEGKTIQQISLEMGISVSTVKRWRKIAGIKRNKKNLY